MATVRDRSGNNPVDLKYSSPNRAMAAASIAGTVPLYGGEIVVALDTGALFRGLAPVAGAWGRVESPTPGSAGGSTGFPNVMTTGPAAGTVFTTFNGQFNTSSDGQVIEKMIINGFIDLRTEGNDNVIIRDCIINGDTFFAITSSAASSSNVLIERCRISSPGNSGSAIGGASNSSNYEVRFCDISGFENGVFPGGPGWNIHDNYIHDLRSTPGNPDPHIDGVQCSGGGTITVRHNTIISWDTSCCIMGDGGFTSIVIDNNLMQPDPLQGGLAHGVIIDDQHNTGGVTITGVSITNNSIATVGIIFPIFIRATPPFVTTGNISNDTGQPIVPSIA